MININFKIIGASVAGFLTLFGGFIAIDDHYAKAAELNKIEARLEEKINQDRQDRIQERMWKLEDRYKDIKKAPQEKKDEYRNLQQEYNKLLSIKQTK